MYLSPSPLPFFRPFISSQNELWEGFLQQILAYRIYIYELQYNTHTQINTRTHVRLRRQFVYGVLFTSKKQLK